MTFHHTCHHCFHILRFTTDLKTCFIENYYIFSLSHCITYMEVFHKDNISLIFCCRKYHYYFILLCNKHTGVSIWCSFEAIKVCLNFLFISTNKLIKRSWLVNYSLCQTNWITYLQCFYIYTLKVQYSTLWYIVSPVLV